MVDCLLLDSIRFSRGQLGIQCVELLNDDTMDSARAIGVALGTWARHHVQAEYPGPLFKIGELLL